MRLTVSDDELRVISFLIQANSWQGDNIITVASLLQKVLRGLEKQGIEGQVIAKNGDGKVMVATDG
jgi:hypothetical protein